MDLHHRYPKLGFTSRAMRPEVYVGIPRRVEQAQREIADVDRRDWFRHHSRPNSVSNCSTAPPAASTSPRPAGPTSSGRAILADVDEAAHHARLVAAGAVGHLSIGCVGSATYSLLPTLSRRLTEELPGVDFSFRGEMLAPDQVEALRTGAIDVALLRPVAADLSLTVHTLRRDRLVVAVPVDHPLARRKRLRAADLAGADLIVHSADRRSVMYDVVLGLLRDAGVEPHIRHEVGETSTLVTLVAGGLGVAVVPKPVTALALDGVAYLPLAGADARVELAVAHRAERSEPHLARTVGIIQAMF
ncbi:LysR family substrate-binding domain-containing protein [Streptomyces sp.]|uniref:LysR family substrate-binding domain-containing protein n=1 Tax=Streptomyces sp. TaxID=1931 RepID=UPI0025FF2CC4|nr:LysR family substrate-binding domain-containing protein [Streptomyces sp.]